MSKKETKTKDKAKAKVAPEAKVKVEKKVAKADVAKATKASKAKVAKTEKKVAKTDVLALREKAGLNQKDFWTKVGVTQSGGSRYETGRAMPKPVAMLVDIVYRGKSLKA